MDQNTQNQNQNQQARPQFKCPGNCLQCTPAQRQYCASQHAYSNMMVLDKVMAALAAIGERLASLQASVDALAAGLEAIRSGEASVFDPNGGEAFPKEFAAGPAAGETAK